MFFEKISFKLENRYTEKQIFYINLILRLVIIALFIILLPLLLFNKKQPTEDDTVADEMAVDSIESIDEGNMLAEAKNKIIANNYSEAQSVLDELKDINCNNEYIYIYEADIYLKQGDYLSALNVLEKGINITSSDLLTNRKNYICNNIVLTEAVSEDGENTICHRYDIFGNLVYSDIYNSAFEITGWNEYTYDSSGLLSNCSIYDADGNLEKRCEYTYDVTNNLILVEDYNSKDVKQGWHEYSYDNIGREVEVLDYGKNKKVGWKTTTEYDSNGRLFRNTGYDGKNQVTGWVDTLYDNNGHVTTMTRYNNKGKVVEWNETFYNNKGNPIDFISYTKNDEIINSTKYIYDTKDRKTEEVYFDEESIEIGYSQFDIANKKTDGRNSETGIKWYYEYEYIGDILTDIDITPCSGTLTFNGTTKYKRIPSIEAAYVDKVTKDVTYHVIGETADFYQVDKGWYFYKNDINIVYH